MEEKALEILTNMSISELSLWLKKFIIPYVITIGYPAEQPKKTKRKEIDEIVIE